MQLKPGVIYIIMIISHKNFYIRSNSEQQHFITFEKKETFAFFRCWRGLKTQMCDNVGATISMTGQCRSLEIYKLYGCGCCKNLKRLFGERFERNATIPLLRILTSCPIAALISGFEWRNQSFRILQQVRHTFTVNHNQ